MKKMTLDMSPQEFINHPLMMAEQYCRTAMRLRKWGDETMRDVFARPIHSTITDSCHNIRAKLWHICDDELKAAVLEYLERDDG